MESRILFDKNGERFGDIVLSNDDLMRMLEPIMDDLLKEREHLFIEDIKQGNIKIIMPRPTTLYGHPIWLV